MSESKNIHDQKVIEELKKRLKENIYKQKEVKVSVDKLSEFIGELSSREEKALRKSRHGNLYKLISVCLEKEKGERELCIKEIIHTKCDDHFTEFAQCLIKSKRAGGSKAHCNAFGKKYFQCFGGNSRNLVMSSLNIY